MKFICSHCSGPGVVPLEEGKSEQESCPVVLERSWGEVALAAAEDGAGRKQGREGFDLRISPLYLVL